MLKRVLVLGDAGDLAGDLAQKAPDDDLEVLAVCEGTEAPSGAGALVAAGAVEAAAGTVLGILNEHESLLTLLAEALDRREAFPTGTSVRVCDHATRFALAKGMNNDERFCLERAALLRGIGKLRVPNSILLKDGLLTYDEWARLHQHPLHGAAILTEFGLFPDIVEIVRCSRECFDGTGYPDGIEGEAIPYLSRVLRVIDVYCAMTSPRHYREGHSTHEAALENLRDERGKHFDPGVVDLFIEADIGKSES